MNVKVRYRVNDAAFSRLNRPVRFKRGEERWVPSHVAATLEERGLADPLVLFRFRIHRGPFSPGQVVELERRRAYILSTERAGEDLGSPEEPKAPATPPPAGTPPAGDPPVGDPPPAGEGAPPAGDGGQDAPQGAAAPAGGAKKPEDEPKVEGGQKKSRPGPGDLDRMGRPPVTK